MSRDDLEKIKLAIHSAAQNLSVDAIHSFANEVISSLRATMTDPIFCPKCSTPMLTQSSSRDTFFRCECKQCQGDWLVYKGTVRTSKQHIANNRLSIRAVDADGRERLISLRTHTMQGPIELKARDRIFALCIQTNSGHTSTRLINKTLDRDFGYSFDSTSKTWDVFGPHDDI